MHVVPKGISIESGPGPALSLLIEAHMCPWNGGAKELGFSHETRLMWTENFAQKGTNCETPCGDAAMD